MSSTSKNIILGFVSTATYAATDFNDKNILVDAPTFGVINTLCQQFIPQLTTNENLQSLFIDPLVASIAQGLVKIVIYGHPFSNGKVIAKSIVAGVSASALTLHLCDNNKLY